MVPWSSVVRNFTLVASVFGLMAASSVSTEAGSKGREARKPVLTNPKFDPTAERVELFAGIEEGRLSAKVVPKDANGGVVLISNESDQPLTVGLPESFVAVPVLNQLGGMGGMGGGMGGMGGGGMGGMGGGGMGGGGNQAAGGGFGGGQGGMGGGGMGGMGGGGMGGMGGGGQGFFSIPPERTVKLPYVSACLNHGKPDPNPNVPYRLVQVSEYTEDPVLTELIRMVGTGKLNAKSAQAAVWTRTDHMTWEQLAAKNFNTLQGVEFFFRPEHIQQGQMIMAHAVATVRESAEESPETEERIPSRVR
ncbi:MAG: hypothetical protein ACK58L_00720 [Planctomycetota bacterium]